MGKTRRHRRIAIAAAVLLACCGRAPALNPSLDVSQYAHTAWTIQEGFIKGNIYAMAQTHDGYLWLGTEFGLLRFDGVRAVPWQPPAGQHLPDNDVNSLLVTRDGTLWIGTFAGLVTLSNGKLSPGPVFRDDFVASLFEDREGTVWAGSLGKPGRLCATGSGGSRCYGQDGSFGRAVWATHEDSSGSLWAGAQSGLWRMQPGLPKRYPTSTELIGLSMADNGRLLMAMHGAGVLELAGENLESYPIPSASRSKRLLADRDINSNRILRDRDGGLWIGTVERGLIHVHRGRTDVYKQSNGLSGDVVLSLFEDREGTVWVATTGGLDRFRELPVATVSVKQGLSSDAVQSVLAARDGSIWIGAHAGVTMWRDRETTIFDTASGLSDDATQSLYEDQRGRIWVSTAHGLAYFKDGRFTAVNGIRGGRAHFITGDKAGNLWVSEETNLLHLHDGSLVEEIPWPELGHHQSAEVLLADPEQGGVWLGFWVGGGLMYMKDRQIRASYTAADGLGAGVVPDLRLDSDGALWAATQGGLSRLKDGRIGTLTTRNGLPCDTIHWTMEDNDGSFWLYTRCGLVRIRRREIDGWIADPKRRIEMTVWGAADGVRLRSSASSEYGPRIAKATDGKLWFVTGDGVQYVDPHHLAFNDLPPPVRIEQITANHKIYWQNLAGTAVAKLCLQALIRDLQIDYTALSLVAPEAVRFRYKLEGYDGDWQDAGNRRQAFYTNLPPRTYRFRVIACNNSGVWNEQGDTLEFSIAPAYWQTPWFALLCLAASGLLLWAFYKIRLRAMTHQFNRTLEARVAERTRIARALHDTLLQGVHGLLFRIQAARNMLPGRSEDAIQALDGAISRAEEAIVESREAIQGLRAEPAPGGDLVQSLNAVGKELAGSPDTNRDLALFRLTVEGVRRPLKPISQDEIHRIARELLRNAFLHAHASQVEAEIRFGDSLFRLRIRDDGTGVDPKVLHQGGRAGHWGLMGIRERATQIGARLKFWSEAGAGTEVELSVPASVAYETSRDGPKSKLFGKASKS